MTETRALGDILVQGADDVFTISDNLDYVEAGAGIELLDRINSGTLDRQFAQDPPEVCTRTWHRQREESGEEPETLIVQQITAAPPGAVIVDLGIFTEWSLGALATVLAYESVKTTSLKTHDVQWDIIHKIKDELERRKEKGA